MAWRRVHVYAVEERDDTVRLCYSPKPPVDAAWWRKQKAKRFVVWQPPLPPAWAHYVQRRLQKEVATDVGATNPQAKKRRLWPFSARRRPRQTTDGLLRRARRLLHLAGYVWPGVFSAEIPLNTALDSREDFSPSFRWPAAADLQAVAFLLQGRLLTEGEAVALADKAGIHLEHSVEECLTALYLLGSSMRRPGLEPTPFGGWRCLRCGGMDEVVTSDCALCGESNCPSCEACQSIGAVRGCTLLYAGQLLPGTSGAEADRATKKYRTPPLTAAQARAAGALQNFLRNDEKKEALIWAVCGAGKTELCFPAVADVLGQKGRVLFAVPRRDVVKELGRRLERAFPAVPLQVLHGGSDRLQLWQLSPGSLTVATTHQLLRFEQAFDFVILDEVDAFPYRGSPMLQRAVANAARPGGRIVRMSATPGERLIKRAESEGILITVPARHHGRPLPVPALYVDETLAKAVGSFWPSPLLWQLIEQSVKADKAKVLLFVPDVPSVERVGRGIARWDLRRRAGGKPLRVFWSHAKDAKRDVKIEALRKGLCDVFVATTILERGVTVPDVDVIVLFADKERVFTDAALVQMAGRVGRTTTRPTGRVAFVGARLSPSMRRAVQQIERLNAEAARLGLLVGKRGKTCHTRKDGGGTGSETAVSF